MNEPVISVIVPCYNEEKYIEKCILSILSQNFSYGELEILVVDGMSTDGTREILKRISESDGRLRVIDNPRKITPVAFNIGISESKGKYVSILGAHSDYDAFYLDASVSLFIEHPEISCSGGPIISKGRTDFGKAAALAMSNTIGVGNAKHRFPEYEGYGEGVCFPTFKKEIFEKIGLFNEKLVRNQDDELNFRLTESGGKVYLSPKAKSIYYVRDSASGLFKQYFQYGYWRVAVIRLRKKPVSFRQVVPAVFFLLMLVLFIAGISLSSMAAATRFAISLSLPVSYLAVLLLYSAAAVKEHGLKVASRIPLAIFILHFAYAAGFFKGMLSSSAE